MTPAEIRQLVKECERDKIKDIYGFAYSNYSGGEKLADAGAHFRAGCQHLIAERPFVIATLTEIFKDDP
jgi:hypothetical protein